MQGCNDSEAFLIDHDKLQEGDVILTSEGTVRSGKIRLYTQSEFSHAMICVGFSSYVHAHGPGVEIANPQRQLFDSPSRVKILRYVGPDRARIIYEACSFVRKRVGTQYSVPEALATKVPRARRNLTNRQFCSRLVAQAYAASGIQLVTDPDYCSPGELSTSRLLSEVPDCLRRATHSEVAFAREKENPLHRQAEAFRYLFSAARRITGEDIQSMPQLEDHLRGNAEHDAALSDALIQSGYLRLWEMDLVRNAWRYDAAKFVQAASSPQELHDAAQREIELAMQDVMRFSQAVEQITASLALTERKFFRLERELYVELVEVHQRRYTAATQALKQAKRSMGFKESSDAD